MRKRVKRGKIILILVVVIFGILVFAILRSDLFNIKAVDIQADNINCTNPTQIKSSTSLLGQNLIFLNSSKVESDLKKKFLCIKAVEISKYFPNKVKLIISKREPVVIFISQKEEENLGILEKFSQPIASASAESTPSAQFIFPQGEINESFIVDNEGVIFEKNVSRVDLSKVYFHGQNLMIGRIIKILQKIKTFGLTIKEAKVYSEKILLVNTKPKIIFRLDEREDIQLASLQLILSEAKIDDRELEFIDLRFDKPVIRTVPKKNGKR